MSLAHPHSQAYAFYYACILQALRGEFLIAQSYAERCIALSEEHGFRQWRLARAVRGICMASLDPSPNALGEIRAALDEYRHAGYQLAITALLVLLCQRLLIDRDYEPALELIESGLAISTRNSERILEAELYRLKARVLIGRGGPDVEAVAQSLLEHALAMARGQRAKALELRAATDLAALCIDQQKREQALDLLAPIYESFTEGFDTRDMKRAKALLDKLR
ncbi:putative ATPase [Bradyrhizobium sp. F1.13.1]